MNRHLSLELTASRFALCVSGAMLAVPAASVAQEAPRVISPLRVDQDRNGINILNGKMSVDVPTLSVPGASRLTFDRVQNAAPYVLGTINITAPDTPRSESYSIHGGGGTSESFKCNDGDCVSVTGTGSTFVPNARRFQRAPDGAIYNFNLKHVDVSGSSTRTVQYYASTVTYPDGEVISYTYETAQLAGDTTQRTWYRPVNVSSNTGYFLTIAYQGNSFDPNTITDWSTAKEAAIFNGNSPAAPLGKLTYAANGTVTDLAGRVFEITGAPNQLGIDIETTNGSVKLPGETAAAVTVSQSASGPMVGSVVRDGVTWNYAYLNAAPPPTSGDDTYDKITITGPDGYSMAYEMGGQGLANGFRNVLRKQTDALGRVTNFTYDTGFRVTSMTLPEGNQLAVSYDTKGNIAAKTIKAKPGSGLADISETTFVDELSCFGVSCYRPVWYRDALGHQTDYVYNSLGQLTEQTDPADASGVRRKTYIDYAVSAGGISRKTAVRICSTPTTCITRAEYDYVGETNLPSAVRQIDLATNAVHETAYTYDAAGRVLSVDGPLPGSDDAQYSRYDILGRKTWEIGGAAANGSRLAKRMTYRDSDDKVTVVETGTVTSATDTNLIVFDRTDMTYDARRNAVREARSAAGTTHAVTDRSFLDRGLNECTTVRMNAPSFTGLPGSACTLGTLGSGGQDRISKNIYDVAGQLVQVREGVGTSDEAAEATYSYTPNGKREYVIDANGNRAQLTYDGHDRQQKWIFPSATRPTAYDALTLTAALATAGAVNTADYEQYDYDVLGNRTSLRKRDGSSLTFNYDALNRVTSKIVPERAGLPASATRDVYYEYDLLGKMTKARFDSLSGEGVANTYDGFGNLVSTSTAQGGLAASISMSYDQTGNRTLLTHPDGQPFKYARDALGRVSNIYEGTSATSSAQLIAATFNNEGRPATIQRALSPDAFLTTFGYDPLGRLASSINDLAGTSNDLTIGQSFNPASQIISQTRSNNAYSWPGGTSATRNYQTNGLNQYTAAGSATLSYDLNGNLTSDGSSTFNYDIENRLVSASGAKAATLVYDPLGRLFETSGGATGATRFLYDGDELIAEYNSANTLTKRYVHSDNVDDPVVQYDGAAIGAAARSFLMSDERGSIMSLVRNDGTQRFINTYDEYGVPGSGNQERFQYTGQAWIPELGMYHYKARIYAPTLGRFLQTDPIGYNDQMNLYAYVGDDPVNANDPSGMAGDCTGSRIGCGGGIASGASGSSTASPTGRANTASGARNFVAGAASGLTFGISEYATSYLGITVDERSNAFTAGEISGIGIGLVSGGIGVRAGVAAYRSYKAASFFKGTFYSQKVLRQMAQADRHAFPELVRNFASSGRVRNIVGGDGATRKILRIPGGYKKQEGTFDFIKNSNGSINHRYFQPE